MAFAPGDIVQLKSGSPVLTVVAVHDGQVEVVWFAEEVAEFRSHSLPDLSLDAVELEEFDLEEEDEDESGEEGEDD